MRTLALCVLLAVVVTICARTDTPTHADPCAPSTIGVDTSVTKFADFVNLGEAVGQTIVANDTTISSITFWRPGAVQTSFTGFHLYVVGTDSSGKPNTADLIQEGPTVFNFYGDGSHAVPFRFVFAPPLVLPRPGRYELAVQADPCGGVLQYLETTTDQYPGGQIWYHSRISPCILRGGPTTSPNVDMLFQVEFCGATTPAKATTWGQLKSRYR